MPRGQAPQGPPWPWEPWAQRIAARADARRPSPNVLVLDAGDGRNLRVELAPDVVRFFAVTLETRFHDEEHDRWEDDPGANSAIDDLVWEVGRPLVLSLRWGLFTKRGAVEYLPEHLCTQCGTGAFDDEEMCPRCGAPLDEDIVHDDGLPGRAAVVKRFVRLLREEGLLPEPPDDPMTDRLDRLFRNGIDNTPERFRSELAQLSIQVEGLSPRRVAVLAEHARGRGSFEQKEVLQLRPPSPSEASSFHDPAGLRPVSLMRLASRPDVKRCTRTRAVVQAREGHVLHLRLKGSVMHVEARAYALGRGRRSRSELEELANVIAYEVQGQTGWYVFEGDAIRREFEPASACTGCGVECFAWQERCARCGWVLGTPDQARILALAIIDALVKAGHVELARSRKEAAYPLAPVVATGTSHQVLDALVDLEAVEEIYGDDEVLLTIIDAATAAP